ncbi:DUF6493 family protein [Nonomuraea sp. NEAU-A123]|uniref:DUF7824 domain-containing protein n=1 Tax=Nonomuraea sp. NEAU-A123 TaxID=2839649 RepID=UPI001BE3DDEF|nr:DUF6493 family protein [Nonomuraea sp. NEAU-A123]MBT2224994.1 hypothetical protein [Nonomuraea sp. NEAU-A123]
MTSWDEIRDLISAGDADKLIERLITLDDAERKLVAGELRGHIPVLSRHAETKQQERWMEETRRREKDRDYWMHWREPEHEPWQDWADLLRLAGAGTLSAVTAVASWVTRRDLAMWRPFSGRTEFGDPAPVVRLLDHRPAEWQAELAVRLAAKVRGPGDPGVALALAMLRHTGAPPPEHDPLVVAWAVTGAAAKSDPLFPALLPRLFEAEGVGRALQYEKADPISPWFSAIRAAGERAVLLDGCVRRFLRGGTVQDLRFFARLHELLEPTAAEIDARRRDYLRLLPAAPGPVAELSLRHLRRLDAHDPADVAEALEGLLFRAEAKLVRSGLTWFDQTVRQAPDRADDLVAALVTAFQHEAYDIQGRAVQLALKHAARFSPLGAEQIRDAIPVLPPALGARLVAVYGGQAAVEELGPAFTPPPLPEPVPVPPFPAAPETPAEMEALGWTSWQWHEGERWLAGFVRLAARDRDGLRSALDVAYGSIYPQLFEMRHWLLENYWRAAIARELVTPGADPGVPAERPGHPAERPSRRGGPAYGSGGIFRALQVVALMRSVDGSEVHEGVSVARVDGEAHESSPTASGPVPETPRDRLPDPRQVSGLDMLVLRRFAEVLAALKDGTLPPVLLATPTHSTGMLDPEVLVSRLAECEAARAVPLPADLRQALLRLPRGAHPEAASRAARLTSEASRTVARRLADGGLPDPEVGVRWSYMDDANSYYFDERRPSGPGQIWLTPQLTAEPTGLDLIDEFIPESPVGIINEYGHCMGWWPSVLPSHREVVAVNLVQRLHYQWARGSTYHVHPAMLAAADGPAGVATALVLAYFLSQNDAGAGASVLVTMAARGALPAAELGAQLGMLIRWTWVKQQHVLNALEAAANRGAHREVWEVLRALLPALLPGAAGTEKPRAGLAKVVGLAVTVAQQAAARGAIPEVEVVAGHEGDSKFRMECRRLHAYLIRP